MTRRFPLTRVPGSRSRPTTPGLSGLTSGPPGSEIWVVGVGFMADWGHLAHLQAGHCGLQPAEGYSDPGAVEALVLSGQRVSSMGDTWGSTQTWTPWYRGPGDP